ncbi:MAG: glycosyltransferase [Phycisphaera sp.]|nr:glycosyltransferase [Phycisphaera sp.]
MKTMHTLAPHRDVLFVSTQPIWPVDHGSSLIGYHLALSLAERGLSVGLCSTRDPAGPLPTRVKQLVIPWPPACDEDVRVFRSGWSGRLLSLRNKLAAHEGIDARNAAGVVGLVRRYRPRAVVGIGTHSVMLLRALNGLPEAELPVTVWYAADELLAYHLTCLRRLPISQWPGRVRPMAAHTLIERLFSPGVDGVVGVSPGDATMLRLIGGARRSVVIRNGVDTVQYSPLALTEGGHAGGNQERDPGQSKSPPVGLQRSVVFWGRLDFLPNVDAVCWFARKVWPELAWRFGDARFLIVGKNPTREVRTLSSIGGVEVVGEVADIRPWAMSGGVTVLPMRCGGGIKNKLLEAAAMARPIVASPRAVRGLGLNEQVKPVVVCTSVRGYVDSIRRLWADGVYAMDLGRRARDWVEREYSWSGAAGELVGWIDRLTPAGLGLSTPEGLRVREAA